MTVPAHWLERAAAAKQAEKAERRSAAAQFPIAKRLGDDFRKVFGPLPAVAYAKENTAEYGDKNRAGDWDLAIPYYSMPKEPEKRK